MTDSVKTLGYYVFSDSHNLSEINIPKDIISIGCYAFKGSKWLENYKDDFLIKYNKILTYVGQSLNFSTKKAPISPKPITINVNNKPVFFDQTPILQDGRTLVPVRAISDALGARTTWDATAKRLQ